jgi:hypothetical protein
MPLNIIDEMLKTKMPKKRLKIILEQHEKNIKYFKSRYPELGTLLEVRGAGRFHINVTTDSLEILDQSVNQICHPPGKLLEYVRTLGAWHHEQWIDKLHIAHKILPGIEHGEKINAFLEEMYKRFPYLHTRMNHGIVRLPRTTENNRYSSTTVFLGVGTGLHIVHYLNSTELRDLILIEPDIDNFCLSTYFLDYAEIDKRIRLVLHVGPDMPESQLDILFRESPITMSSWLRILPAYPSGNFVDLINRLHLRWRELTEIFVPFDREVRNLCYGMQNLKAQLPINHISPKLSENSRVAIVASGPSLLGDIPWLKQNQDNLIILAAHSAVKVLKQHNIKPDFQCSLDTEIEDDLMDKLDLYYDVPYVSYYKADPNVLRKFERVLLINEENKANPVKFLNFLHNTHPTTGNLTTSFAIFCQPSEIYFIGLDLGFKDLRQEHVSGYWLGEADIVAEYVQSAQVTANFPESEGIIHTQSYYNNARMSIEQAIKPFVESGKKVFNLADGARIVGAEAAHSVNITLSAYPEKSQDILAIIQDGFSTNVEQVWVAYKTPGNELLSTIRESLLESITLPMPFNWIRFSRCLDMSLRIVMSRCASLEEGDIRVEAYHKLLSDLLTEWYRVIILTHSPSETKAVYHAGITIMKEVLDTLTWPEVLDLETVNH